jgi:hypothetical protein
MSYNLSLVPEFTQILEGNNGNKSLNVTNYTFENKMYQVVRYDKDILYVNHQFGLFRSVIINDENKVVSFAPPKSLSSETFIELNPVKADNILAEEFIEGTMINVFWDHTKWNISTRNTIGAEVSFFKKNEQKTFSSMFLEALKECNLDLNELNQEYCYSFVLQHPDNRIVVPISTPTLYLVQVYKITHEMECIVDIISMNDIREQEIWKTTLVKFPAIYTGWNNYDDLIDKYASNNSAYNLLGVVIKNIETNNRCKIRNPIYENVRHLKGNQPKLQYHYLSLRKTGKIGEYLAFYPECKGEFSKFRDELHVFTNTLFANYVSCYIRKEKPLGEYNGQYKTHMFNLHKLYLNELKEKKLFVTNRVVIDYVNNLHESQQMHSLHYPLKKQMVDFVKADHTHL